MNRSLRIGVCSWSLRPDSCDSLLASLESIPIDAVQLALVPLIEHPRQWCEAASRLRTRGVTVLSGMMATIGEDYSTLDSIARTGGFRPDETWKGNLDRALRVADVAADAGIPLVTVHAGFIPEDPRDPARRSMLERLGTVASIFSRRGIALALETGQERAATLISFLRDLGSPSVGVNFDPANMILYGMGDPIEAVELLAPSVRQIHLKDAVPAERPGSWGREVALGRGAVDWTRFGEIVRRFDPPVDLVIEREQGGTRVEDVRGAIAIARSMLPG